MSIKKFDFFIPKNIDEATKILYDSNGSAVIMAGGTDLLIKIHQHLISPKLIIGLKNIRELNFINFEKKKGLTIGAATLLSSIVKHKEIIEHYPTIAKAANSTANCQIRNMGTIIGNVCNASPSADNIPILIAMKGILNIKNTSGYRQIKIEELLSGPGIINLSVGEIVDSIFIPEPRKNYGTSYVTLSQRGNIDCTAVGVAVMLSIYENKFENIRVVVGACSPVPTRALKTEKILKGNNINNDIIYEASSYAAENTNPISDLRASARYRKKMIKIISIRAINEAIKMATKKK